MEPEKVFKRKSSFKELMKKLDPKPEQEHFKASSFRAVESNSSRVGEWRLQSFVGLILGWATS